MHWHSIPEDWPCTNGRVGRARDPTLYPILCVSSACARYWVCRVWLLVRVPVFMPAVALAGFEDVPARACGSGSAMAK